MANHFLISDTHFGHKGVTEFLNYDGSKLRPWDNVEEMDEALVSNWNKVVGPKDRVYHLGDVAMNNRCLDTVSRLNGIKILIMGNHDNNKISQYAKYFQDLHGCHQLDRCILSHIPVHPTSKGRFVQNFHGHTHSNRVHFETGKIDPWYQCVCVEQINYTPISLEDAKIRARKEKEALGSQQEFLYNMGM